MSNIKKYSPDITSNIIEEDRNKTELKELCINDNAKEIINLVPHGLRILSNYEAKLFYDNKFRRYSKEYNQERTEKVQKIVDRAKDIQDEYVSVEVKARRVNMTVEHYQGLSNLLKNYYGVLNESAEYKGWNHKLPYHVEKLDKTSPYKLNSLEQYQSNGNRYFISKLWPKHSVTITPLTFKNRIKMKLEHLYKTVRSFFVPKPLTAVERAKKAFLDKTMTGYKIYGSNLHAANRSHRPISTTKKTQL